MGDVLAHNCDADASPVLFMKDWFRQIVTLILLTTCIEVSGHTLELDTLSLDTIVVEAPAWSQSLRIKSGNIILNRKLTDALPQFAGEADYLKTLQLFPNIMTNNEYDTGVYIQGGDASHNDVLIGGAPVYQIGHLFGIFSSFNATHYPSLQMYSATNSGSFGNRLGGTLTIEPSFQVHNKFGGEISISPLAVQGTLRCPLSSSTSLTLSARTTYVDLLYSQWLKNENDHLSYRFTDINASLISTHNKDRFQIDFYYTTDKLGIKSETAVYDLITDWDNLAVSCRWQHDWNESISVQQTLLYSSFLNSLKFSYANAQLSSPASIASWGYKAKMKYHFLDCGLEYTGHNLSPQEPISLYREGRNDTEQYAHELSCFADVTRKWRNWQITLGMRFCSYVNPQHHFSCNLNPQFAICYTPTEYLTVNSTVYLRHQYLFRSGLSSVGLPIEFWFAADSSFSPQRAIGINLSCDWLVNKGKYALSIELFYKYLSNQCEYIGDLMQLWDSEYLWRNQMAQGKGRNYGIGFIFQKRLGRLTGWASYSFNRSKRAYNTAILDGDFPSSHDRPHQLKSVAAFRINNHWSLGADYVLASGTPFTAPKAFYIVNGNIISQYGTHNGKRLPAYRRVDLSASYEIKNKVCTFVVNLTLYNVLFLKKPIFYRLKFYEGEYGYRGVGFVARMLPSISLSVKF